MRKWLWDDILNNVGFYDSAWLPVHAMGSVIVIFAVCSVIDLIRIKLVERPFLDWWDKHEERLSNSYKCFERKVFEKMNISID